MCATPRDRTLGESQSVGVRRRALRLAALAPRGRAPVRVPRAASATSDHSTGSGIRVMCECDTCVVDGVKRNNGTNSAGVARRTRPPTRPTQQSLAFWIRSGAEAGVSSRLLHRAREQTRCWLTLLTFRPARDRRRPAAPCVTPLGARLLTLSGSGRRRGRRCLHRHRGPPCCRGCPRATGTSRPSRSQPSGPPPTASGPSTSRRCRGRRRHRP